MTTWDRPFIVAALVVRSTLLTNRLVPLFTLPHGTSSLVRHSVLVFRRLWLCKYL